MLSKVGFVSGHDFSRAARWLKLMGFSLEGRLFVIFNLHQWPLIVMMSANRDLAGGPVISPKNQPEK
jgi:hypothetical protein